MNIFDINREMQELLDTCVDEDGSITEDAIERLSELQQEKDTKLENLACYIVNLNAEAKAMREQEKAIADRRHAVEKKSERLTKYLMTVLDGEKLADESRVCVKYTKSRVPETDEGFIEWAMSAHPYLLRYKEPEVDKTALRAYLKDHDLPNARMVESVSMRIV